MSARSLSSWLGALALLAAPAAVGAEPPEVDLPDARVEEMVVYGFRTGSLPPIPGPVTHTLFVDDFVAEDKSLADLLAETAGLSVRRFGGVGDRSGR